MNLTAMTSTPDKEATLDAVFDQVIDAHPVESKKMFDIQR